MALRTQPAGLQYAIPGWLADHRVALTGCDTWSFGAAGRHGARPEPVTAHA
jgi:hypothetical protein